MQVQVSTDNHVAGSADLHRLVEAVVGAALERFGDRITRVEAHLSDENSGAKASASDKRCALEARLAGLQPITVSHQGATLEQAIEGAADKLEKTLERTLGRQGNVKGRVSFGGDQTV